MDFKNWQVCTVAYTFGLLLPLFFSGDVNKFLSKGNVLSGELFLYYVFRFGFVSSQLAWSTGRVSSILYETALLCKAESCLGDSPPLGRRESTGGEGQGAFASCTCKYPGGSVICGDLEEFLFHAEKNTHQLALWYFPG